MTDPAIHGDGLLGVCRQVGGPPASTGPRSCPSAWTPAGSSAHRLPVATRPTPGCCAAPSTPGSSTRCRAWVAAPRRPARRTRPSPHRLGPTTWTCGGPRRASSSPTTRPGRRQSDDERSPGLVLRPWPRQALLIAVPGVRLVPRHLRCGPRGGHAGVVRHRQRDVRRDDRGPGPAGRRDAAPTPASPRRPTRTAAAGSTWAFTSSGTGTTATSRAPRSASTSRQHGCGPCRCGTAAGPRQRRLNQRRARDSGG